MRQFSHLDAVFGDFAFRIEGKTGSSFVDRDDVQIDFWSEPPVQFNLALAEIAAFLQRAEIEKSEIDRLLHFEDKRRRDEHPRNVGLKRAYFLRPMRIRRGRFEKRNQLPLKVRTAHRLFSRHERRAINLNPERCETHSAA